MQWQATAQPLGEFVAKFPDFVAKCRILLPLEEFVTTCKKTVQVPFPHPTLTGKSHTTNNTMIDYYPSAATTANAAADSPEALPPTMTQISVATRMARRTTLRTRRQMMMKGWRTCSFVQQETSRTERPIASGQLVWRTTTFKKKLVVNISIVSMVWDMLVASGLRPEKSCPKHLLWALYFLKVYPKQSSGCSVVGASMGAVDPKTIRKWVWQFIENIADLAEEVVSLFVNSHSHVAHCHLMPSPPPSSSPSMQIVSESRLGAHDVRNDCTVDGTDFWIPQQGAAERGNAFAPHKNAGKLALRYELGVDILAGNLV
jgi:hypothetical protein